MFGNNYGRRQWKEGPVMAALPMVSAGLSILGAAKSLFSKGPSTPKAPEVAPPTVMPTEDTKAVQEAKRRSLIEQSQRGGRASTILTDTDNGKFGN